jgi:hypothetical protein
MSKSLKNSPDLSWDTPESYWPFPRPLAEAEPMMLRLLEVQFGHLVKKE